MKSYTLRLHSIPFSKVLEGKKIIESRLNDEKRREFRVGDELIFISRENGKEIKTVITKLHHFPNFADLFQNIPAEKFGGISSELLLEEIEQFYSLNDQLRYGVVGIEFKVNPTI